jgi:predicted nucleic-acid-binding protein
VIGIDTNVLIRHIVQDDAEQARAATNLIETCCTAESPGIVSLIVLCELVWALDRGYGYGRDVISSVLRRILAVEDLRVEHSELAWLALNFYERGKADFADYLIGLIHREHGAEYTYTLDRRALDCELFRIPGK